MLSLLHIENIAVIEQADIVFDRGFHVLTGETGAGKSIVIDAISAVLGERAYRDMIRTGENKASVRAIFTGVKHLSWFEDNGVPYQDEIMIQREIYLDGRNICKVNGCPVTVFILRQLGIQLINIHGQHDSATLFDENNHLLLLDKFGENAPLRSAYTDAYNQVICLRQEIAKLHMDEGEKLRRMESLSFQIEEITKAQLMPGEDDSLMERRKILQNAEKLADSMNAAADALYGNEDSDGAASLLSQAEKELGRLSRFTDEYNSLLQQLTDLRYQVQDLADEVISARDSLSYSDKELDVIESRLDVIHKLKRKYGNSCQEILNYLANAQQELDNIQFADEHFHRLNKDLCAAEKRAWSAAEKLRQSRIEAGESLSQQILAQLQDLDMPKVQFSCKFTQLELTPNGADGVAFYMSANTGEALKPLSKVASGGELARIMLAIKQVLAQQDDVQTLIFDEVDTGVSGRAAQKVAQKLKSVAKNKQVLCVTHLPQIAALGEIHMLISKAERDCRTYTSVTPLDKSGRIEELARMIGGAKITDITRKSAAEMLVD